MTMKASAPLAIAVAIATVLAKEHQPTVAQTVFSIRGGETLPLRLFASITSDCVSTFTGFDGIDILDGPPEITLKFEPGKVVVHTAAGRVCKPVSGGTIMIAAAKDIGEQQEADLTFRVRYRTKHINASTLTYRYRVLMFPAAGEPTAASTQ
jgi:hypothetical protein